MLERILGSHPQVRALGEIKDVVDPEVAEYFWNEVAGSAYWQQVRQELGYAPAEFPALDALQKSHESLWRGWRRWLLGPRPAYERHVTRVFRAALSAADPGTEWLIDSSKTSSAVFFRPHLLARLPGWDVKVIHLVRDGRGCLFSILKGSNKLLEKGQTGGRRFPALRASLGWLLANLSGLLFASTCRRKYLRIRYEALVDDPVAVLGQIGQFLNLDLSTQQRHLERHESIPAADQFSGNRLRKQGTLVLKKDVEWVAGLRWWHKACFWLIAWPIPLLERILEGRHRARSGATEPEGKSQA